MADTAPQALKRPSFTPGARRKGHTPPTAAEQREIEADIRRDRIAAHGPAMIALVAEAKAFREKWGVFTRNGWRLDSVARYGPYVSEADEEVLRQSMTRTVSDALEIAAKALAAPYVPVDGDNDMSDAQVAAGIRWLRVDGWNAFDESRGHCCFRLLDIDYAGAIALARGIIGKYSKTLYKVGVL